ncbi:MurR/RpiR family transcriptional regulator [Enterococcus hulanensis]|uniref:MurR/RpiR family transcriptional regulator n=1 Tax=Enterococcus hulanensis TaxID=2559929 RepID=UPI0010F8C2F4|nr:MurR/RpiR family transcriptional regulator [Enterococcus hulanensis]
MKLLRELKNTNKFSESENHIAGYLLEHLDTLSNLTLNKLAAETFTSQATVNRFCKKMGFRGFSDFRLKLSQEAALSQRVAVLPTENLIDAADSLNIISGKISSYFISAIEETRSSLDLIQLERITERIMSSKRIDYFCFDDNFYIAENITSSFMSAGIHTLSFSQSNLQFLQSIIIEPNDVAFIFSKSGTNKKLIEIMKLLKAKNIYTVLFTPVLDSPLAMLAEEVVYVVNNENFLDLGYSLFSVSLHYLLTILAEAILAKNTKKAKMIDQVYSDIAEKFY